MRLDFKSWDVVAVDMVTFSAVTEMVLLLRFSILVLGPFAVGVGGWSPYLAWAVLGCMFEFEHTVW